MNNNSIHTLNIRLFKNNSHHQQMTFSKEMNRKQETIIRHKILNIAQAIRTQFPKDEVKDLKFIMKSTGEFRVIIRLKEKDLQYSFDNLDSKIKKEATLLIDIVKRLNITSLKDASKAPHYPLIDTNTTFTHSFSRSETKSILQRAVLFFQTFFTFYGFVRPLTNRLIGKEIDGSLDMHDLKNLYINSEDLLNQIKKEIRIKYPSIFNHYSEKEINASINDQFIHQINDRLARLHLPPLSEKTVYRLDVQRILKYVATKGMSKDAYSSLAQVNPLDMPLKELAEIPVTPQQEDALADIWKGVIGNLFAKGRLDRLSLQSDSRAIIVQTAYASHYLEALKLMPEPIKRDLEDFIVELNQKQSPEALQDFIIQHSAITEEAVKISDSQLEEKQAIYRKKIQPEIKNLIEKNVLTANDSSLLIKYLAIQEGSYTEIEKLVEKILSKLSKSETKLYDKEVIKKFIFNECEHVAVFDYHFSTPQIVNLRNARNKFNMKVKHKKTIENNIKDYKETKSELEAKYKEKLQEQRNQLIDPLIQLPMLDLPLEATSEKDRQVIIKEITSEIPQSLQLINKKLKQIEKELKDLKKLQGRKAKEAQIAISDKLSEKSTLEAKKSSLERLKIAKETGNKDLLNQLVLEITSTPIKSHKVNALELNPLYVKALQDLLNAEEKKLIEVDEKINQTTDHREAKKLKNEVRPSIEEKIAELKALFEKIEKVKKNHDSLNQIENHYQAQLRKLDNEFIAKYEMLLDSYVSIDALLDFAHTSLISELYPVMWEKALTRLLEATPAVEPKSRLNSSLKKSLKPYIEAKAKFFRSNLAKKTGLFEALKRVDHRIQNRDIKNYTQEAVKTEQDPSVEDLLFNEEVLSQITTSESAPLTSSQQADLMRLTKLFNKATQSKIDETPVPLTKLEKQELKETINRLEQDDSIMEALNRFPSDDNDADIEQFLSFAPPFLRWFTKKFIVKDSKKTEKFIPGGISSKSIEFLKIYLSKTKKIAKEEWIIKELHAKAEQLIGKYKKDPTSITPSERLSLKELGKISRVARLNESDDEDRSFLGLMDDLGLIGNDPKLLDFQELVQKSQAFIQEIENLIRPSVNAHYKDGDLLAYVGNKKSAWLDTPVSFEEQMTRFIANGFTHGAKLYKEGDDVHLSHIYGNLEQEKMSLYQLCISDVWELDIAPLIAPSMHESLKDIYGRDWKTDINALYQEIEQELHLKGKEQFKEVGNDLQRRLAAGFANHPLLFKFFGKKGVKGHKRHYERDFKKIHGKFFEGAPLQGEQICSEFASKTTLVSMIELNKRLAQAIHKHTDNRYAGANVLKNLAAKNVEMDEEIQNYLSGQRHFKADAHITKQAERKLKGLLKTNGYSQQEISLIIRLGNEEIIDLPYSKKERLKAIHPGRMVSLLVDKQCARLRPPPQAVETLIALK